MSVKYNPQKALGCCAEQGDDDSETDSETDSDSESDTDDEDLPEDLRYGRGA